MARIVGVAAALFLGCAGDDGVSAGEVTGTSSGGMSTTGAMTTTGDATTSAGTSAGTTSGATAGESETSGGTSDTGDTPGCVVHVDGARGDDDAGGGSWFLAKRTVNAGLDEAHALALAGRGPCEVWVAAGTYRPSEGGDVDASFTLRAGIALYGGFAGDEGALGERDWVKNETVLSGELGDPSDLEDNARHVVVGADGARIDGFTITGGYARGDATQRNGAGVAAGAGALTIANCRIADNVTGPGGDGEVNTVGGSGGMGAGIYVAGGALTLVDSLVIGNKGGRGGWGSAVGGVGGEGAGVAVIGGSSLVVTRVNFEGNVGGAGGEGGDVGGPGGGGVGLLVSSVSGPVRIEASVFKGNSGGAGGASNKLGGPGNGGALTLVAGAGDVVVERCAFVDNLAGAGGASGNLPGGAGGLSGMLFAGNAGPGGLVLANSIFTGNTGDFAPALGIAADPMMAGGPIVVVNARVAGNVSAASAGAVYLRANGQRAVTIANTTITGNSAVYRGGGLWYQPMESMGAAPIRLVNSILWGNEAPQDPEVSVPQIMLMAPAKLEIDASLVAGGCAATSAITCGAVLAGDPSFVDAGSGDLHLGPGSPAIDAGDDSAVPADGADLDDDGDVMESTPVDLDEAARRSGGRVDLGAYERP